MMKIGLFDSGIGGLSVAYEINKLRPDLSIDYVADKAFMPYGPKSDEEISHRVFYLYDLLKKRGADVVVIACNTATAAGIDRLRAAYPLDEAIVGVEPYLKMPDEFKGKSVGISVLTTVSTNKSMRFKKLLDKQAHRYTLYALPHLAAIIENNFDQKEKLRELVIQELKDQKVDGLDVCVLGCTHYLLIEDLLKDVLPHHPVMLNPAKAVAQRAISFLPEKKEEISGQHFYLDTHKDKGESWRSFTFKEFFHE